MGEIVFPNLGIHIDTLDRVAFKLFGFEIYWYGILIGIGALGGILLAVHEAKRTGQDPDTYTDFAFWGIICGVVGARLYYLIFHSGSVIDFFKIREGGLAIYGGIIGGVLSAVIYTKVKKIPFTLFADTAVTSLYVGQIFGRWGNFFNREAFGRFTNSLFALCYRLDTVPGAELTNGSIIYNNAVYPVTYLGSDPYIQVHPTFLYELIWNLASLIFLMIYKKHKKYTGEILVLYCALYGFGRFWIESLRTDQLMIFTIPVSMLVSAAAFGAATGIELYMLKKYKCKKNT